MIVTRRRRKPFPWKRLLIPTVLIALLVAVLWWAPSRTWIAQRPIFKPIAKLFDPLAQQQTIKSQDAQISDLQQRLAAETSQIADRDKQTSQLQTQLNDAQQQAASANVPPKPKPMPQASAQSAAASDQPAANDPAAQASPEMRRTAQVWGAMDSEAAAKIVQRLPTGYVARVFALMSPDSVGAILENLPPAYAARLTQEHPEVGGNTNAP